MNIMKTNKHSETNMNILKQTWTF